MSNFRYWRKKDYRKINEIVVDEQGWKISGEDNCYWGEKRVEYMPQKREKKQEVSEKIVNTF